MTNVPENIRQCWKELYILFDTNYNMDGSEEAWIQYWKQAKAIVMKYGDEIPLLQICEAIANMIHAFVNKRKTGNKSVLWGKDEEYPHPRKEET